MEGNGYTVPDFSTTWEGMGVLVEEAREQGIYLEFINYNEGYKAEARRKSGDKQTLIASIDEYLESIPLAISLVFLKANGVAI